MDELTQIQALLDSASVESTAFQSVLVTSLLTLNTVREQELRTEQAAISLGQQMKVRNLIHAIESVQSVLRSGLNRQGQKILILQKKKIHIGDTRCTSWWDCIAAAIETLTRGIDCIGSIINGQTKNSPARNLGLLVKSVLLNHHRELLAESDEALTQ